jgi:UDPglucose 6-dehydrogenase
MTKKTTKEVTSKKPTTKPTENSFAKKIAVIGTGYVGLVSGACLAEIGHHVICVDRHPEKIAKLKKGISPIYEPGIEPIIKNNLKAGRLEFTEDLVNAVKKSDVIFIAVNTPPRPDGKADLSHVANAARQIAEVSENYKVVVDKSTVPVQTGAKVLETLHMHNPHGIEFDVVSNPEFLREGSAVDDFLHPDRIVIGSENKRAEKIMREIYAPIKAPFIATDINSAELIKHASNSFLATKISFANALAAICELTGANVEEVTYGMGLDKRIGASFLKAGIGYGGSCFPKDVSAFVKIAEEINYDFSLLKSVEKINEDARINFIKKIEDILWIVKNKKIAVWGLSFKPNTDDMRSAPSITVIEHLRGEGAYIQAYDPEATEKAKGILGNENITYTKSALDAVKDADALIIVTDWDEFKEIDLSKVQEKMHQPIIIDGRNIFDPAKMKKQGFVYYSIGR